MKKRKQLIKLWTVLTLFVALITVQTMQIIVEASTGTVDFSKPSTVVSNISELQSAIEDATDGDVIGIDSVITIDSFVEQLGSVESGKYLYIVHMNEDAYFDIVQGGNITLCNMTIDGDKSNYIGNQAMFHVTGTLTLLNLTVQNCGSQSQGGAVYIGNNGTLVTDGVVFDGNSAYQGGHIYSNCSANLNNSILKNGTATSDGGAIKVCSGTVLSLTSCKLFENSASSYGGAVSNSGNITLSNSIVFDNVAPAGSDIANDKYSSRCAMDSLETLKAKYEAEGITPIEWMYDCTEITPEISTSFDVFDTNSLMKLSYKDNRYKEDDSDNQGSDTDETEGSESGNEVDTDNKDSTDIENADDSEKDSSADKTDDASAGSNNSSNGSGASGNDSSSTENSNSTSDKGSSETITNNYYTYNTTVPDLYTTETGVSEVKTSNEVSDNAVSDSTSADAIWQSPNVQIPDNIKLNLNNVDTLYELIIPNIEQDIKLKYLNVEYLDALLLRVSGVSKSSGNKSRELLNLAMKDAVMQGEIRNNPVTDTKPYPIEIPSIMILSREKLKIFLKAASGSEWNLEIMLALFCGLRKGEILGLKFGDVDIVNGTVHIQRQITSNPIIPKGHSKIEDYRIEEKAPKTENSFRILKLPSALVQEINKRSALIQKNRAERGNAFIDRDYISCQGNGLPHSLSAMNNALTRLCKRNGLPHITVHGLRHMYATILLEQGVPLVKISALLGHSSVSTTFEYYCDQMDENEKILSFMNDSFIPEEGWN